MMKSRIFIGSSTESKPYAAKVKEFLEPEFECQIWTDNFFEINRGTYENLVRQAVGFDFAVFIGGKDDRVTRISKAARKTAPRDNVYLEFGLYAGILSPARSYFLFDWECKIASDLEGITVLLYRDDREIQACCVQISEKIRAEERLNRIRLLPSTSLAIGYFENFLVPTARALLGLQILELDGKMIPVEGCEKNLEILIPGSGEQDWATWGQMYYRKIGAQKVALESELRRMAVLFDYGAFSREHRVRFIDVPQTLRAAFQSVNLVIGKDFVGSNELLDRAKKKEVDNFIRTLDNLIRTDACVGACTSVKVIDTLSEGIL